MNGKPLSNWKTQLAFGSAILILLTVGAISYRAMVVSNESDLWVRHTQAVLQNIQGFRSAIGSLESSYRGFTLTGDESYLVDYRLSIFTARKDAAALRTLTSDNAAEQRRLQDIERLVTEKIQFAETVINLRRAKGREAGAEAARGGQGQRIMEEIQVVVREMQSEERRLMTLRTVEANRRVAESKIVLIAGILLGLLITTAAGWSVHHDSAKRRLAEEALLGSEEDYRMLLNGVPDYAIFLLDPQGQVTSWNVGAERTKGYRAEEIIGRNFSCFFTPEDIKRGWPQEVLRLTAANGRHEEEGVRVRKDGSRFWSRVTITALRDPAGNLLGFSKIGRDLTSSKESEAKYRGLLEAAPDAIVVVNQDGEIVLLNVQAEKQFGYSRDELLGKSVKSIIPEGFAERLVADALRSTADALAQQIGTGIELTGRRKNGSDFPIEIMLSPLESTEGILITAAVRDISVRKDAEEHLAQMESRYRGLLEAAPDAMVVVNKAGEIVLLNVQAEKQFGYSRDELLGKSVKSIIPEGFAERLVADALRSTADALAQQIGTGIELTGRRKNGSDFPIEIMLSPLESAEGILVTAAVREISVRKEEEEHLAQMESRYRGLLEAAPDAMVVVNKAGEIVLLNVQAEKQFGYSRDELLGKTIKSIIPEGFAERLVADGLRSTEAALAQQMGTGIELTGRRQDGSAFPIEIMLSPLASAEGTLVTAAIRDISVRKRVEETLRNSEERFRLIAETIDEVFWIVNPHFTEVSYISPGYERVWGRTQASLYENARSFLEPVHPKDLERTLLRFEVMKSGKPFDHEYRIMRPDGAIRWVWNRGFPINNEKGEVTRYVGVAQDITERKGAEERLLEYEKALESLDDMILVIDRDYRYVIANRAYLNYRHLTSEQLVEHAIPDFMDKHLFETVVKNRMDECFQGKVVKYEMQNKFLGLGERDLSVSYFPIDGPAGIDRIVCVLKDITERKRAGAEHIRLMTAIEQAAEAVVITDAEGGIEYVNPAFSAMTGYDAEEVLGKNTRILKSGKHDATFYSSMWATILAGHVWRGEMINRRKDGSLYTEKMSITPVHDEQGKMTHVVAMKEDITARKLLEDQFRQAQKMEAVGRLAAGVAHDFNNLLTIIIGYSDLMLDRFVATDPMRAYTVEIRGAGERAAGLTRQLLAFSRQQVLAPQVLDLNTLIANLAKLLKRLIGEDIDFVFNPGPGPAKVKADPGLLDQVLMNLAVNSRDAMPRGGKLTVETSQVEVDKSYNNTHFSIGVGPYIMLAVSDTGTGMDKETQAHIFEPFFTTKEQGKGTGLGLATAYGIVKQSGGHIWVYSEPGAGTTFKIYLPFVNGDVHGAQESAAPAGGTETVLLVEDDSGLRELARMVLVARGGYKVLESIGGQEARVFAEGYKGRIHLLLTDVVMPGMSGRELGEGLAVLRPDMKILYMSGYTDDTVVRHGVLEEGMPFLQKPFSAESLLRKVRDVLDTQPRS